MPGIVFFMFDKEYGGKSLGNCPEGWDIQYTKGYKVIKKPNF